MSTFLDDLVRYADDLLQTATTPDYPSALNGIQFENRSPIRSIAAAVDFSMRAIEGAITTGSNLLVVHHGMFWSGLEPLTGASYKRIRSLVEADIAVYASHLPLDRHSTLGNNTLLAKELGLKPSAPFAHFGELFIGLRGNSEIDTAALVTRARKFARIHGGDVQVSSMSEGRLTKRWAICTGGGASAEILKEARAAGIDTLITGEGPHWSAVHAEENDLVIIYAGHYATETLGINALALHLGEKFDLPSHFISAPTGL